jgi:endoglucanase
MDAFFELTEKKNISVLLDFHRLYKTQQSPKPYDNKYSFELFCDTWRIILERYRNKSNLLAVDIFNEFQSGDYEEWNDLATRAVLYIEEHFPGRFRYFVGGVNWGGNLQNVNLHSSVTFTDRDRIVYTIHKYHFSDAEPREEKWSRSFKENNTVVGEWGFVSSRSNEVDFAKHFVAYLKDHNMRDTFFWTWSFNSGDTGGILLEDCESIDHSKMDILNSLWNVQPVLPI